MQIHGKWLLIACMALASGLATAKGGDAAPEPLETLTMMHVDGQILIDTDGRVESFEVATKIASPLEAALLKLVKQWRFNPVLVNGVARRAGAKMRVVLAAAREGEGYRVHIDNVVFPGDAESDKEFGPSRVGHPEHITGRSLEYPLYPIVLQMHGIEGTVLLAILIGPDGKVEQVKPMQSMLFDLRGSDKALRKAIGLMEASARATARRWTFNMPASKRGGTPSERTVCVPVEYVMGAQVAPGQWRDVVRVPQREVEWLPPSDTAQGVGVADVASGEVIPLTGSMSLAIPVNGSPVM